MTNYLRGDRDMYIRGWGNIPSNDGMIPPHYSGTAISASRELQEAPRASMNAEARDISSRDEREGGIHEPEQGKHGVQTAKSASSVEHPELSGGNGTHDNTEIFDGGIEAREAAIDVGISRAEASERAQTERVRGDGTIRAAQATASSERGEASGVTEGKLADYPMIEPSGDTTDERIRIYGDALPRYPLFYDSESRLGTAPHKKVTLTADDSSRDGEPKGNALPSRVEAEESSLQAQAEAHRGGAGICSEPKYPLSEQSDSSHGDGAPVAAEVLRTFGIEHEAPISDRAGERSQRCTETTVGGESLKKCRDTATGAALPEREPERKPERGYDRSKPCRFHTDDIIIAVLVLLILSREGD